MSQDAYPSNRAEVRMTRQWRWAWSLHAFGRKGHDGVFFLHRDGQVVAKCCDCSYERTAGPEDEARIRSLVTSMRGWGW